MTDKEVILELLKTLGDIINYCQSRQDLVFDKKFPWHLANNRELLQEARKHLDPHKIWDLTYDEQHKIDLKKALGKYDEKDDN